MTPEQFKEARRALAYSQQALADEWSMGPMAGAQSGAGNKATGR